VLLRNDVVADREAAEWVDTRRSQSRNLQVPREEQLRKEAELAFALINNTPSEIRSCVWTGSHDNRTQDKARAAISRCERDVQVSKEQINITRYANIRSAIEEVVLVTYRSVSRDPVSGKERHALRSSIWKLIDGRWQMTFHQGTPTA
jgi:hypothetical protein